VGAGDLHHAAVPSVRFGGGDCGTSKSVDR
jgi:hypothetical protein